MLGEDGGLRSANPPYGPAGNTMLDNFKWPKIEHEADKVVIRNVRESGCHIVGIPNGDPEFAFSIGLFLNYDHPEIIIIGLDGDDAAVIINDIRDRAAKGRKFSDGDICDDLLADHKVCFVEVPLEAYANYLGIAIWFYEKLSRPFPCLQMVWPDREGRFPWDPGAGEDFKKYQAVLGAFRSFQ
ncbi:MAG: DUF4262 domain-containing protein [Bradyrhizobium sp.]